MGSNSAKVQYCYRNIVQITILKGYQKSFRMLMVAIIFSPIVTLTQMWLVNAINNYLRLQICVVRRAFWLKCLSIEFVMSNLSQIFFVYIPEIFKPNVINYFLCSCVVKSPRLDCFVKKTEDLWCKMYILASVIF
jgi:hypothetical protein